MRRRSREWTPAARPSSRMMPHCHHLAFNQRADVSRRARRPRVRRCTGCGRNGRRDLRFEPRQHQRAVVSGRCRCAAPQKRRPNSCRTTSRTRSRAREPFLNTVMPMNSPSRRGEHVAGAVRAHRRRRHRAEDGVARAERNRQLALADQARPDHAGRVVARPGDDPHWRQVEARAASSGSACR